MMTLQTMMHIQLLKATQEPILSELLAQWSNASFAFFCRVVSTSQQLLVSGVMQLVASGFHCGGPWLRPFSRDSTSSTKE